MVLATIEMKKREPNVNGMKSGPRLPRTGWLTARKQPTSAAIAYFPQKWMSRAKRRVGETPIEQLRWLLIFARGARDEMSKDLALGNGSILMHELVYFASLRDPQAIIHDPAAIIDAADRLEHGLRELLDRGSWKLRLPGGVICTLHWPSERAKGQARTDDGNWSGRLKSEYSADRPAAAILLRAKEIVEAEGLRLRICDKAGCSNLFVKQKRGRFCGPRCSQRERVRTWRKAHPEEASKRWHENYLRRLEKKNPAAAEHLRSKTVGKRNGGIGL
jgi:hypothetical protein